MVLITGITGSLGSRLAKHYLDKGWTVRGMSRCEDKQSRMKREYPKIEFYLGDIRNEKTCFNSCKNVDLVIHTAALKRIEMGEEHPWEFIQTNLIGTRNIAMAAKENNSTFVLVSTDKACKPINLYGMTKAIAEKIVTNLGFNCVRYGNVNNSRGSVIPYWKQLKLEGKPLTITNLDMTRFMIDYDRAIEMIGLASEKMGGRIYIPKLKSVSIKQLLEVFDSKHKIIGERPGEKLHEVLINEDEFRGRVVDEEGYYIILKDNSKVCRGGRFEEYSSETAERTTNEELKEVIWGKMS